MKNYANAWPGVRFYAYMMDQDSGPLKFPPRPAPRSGDVESRGLRRRAEEDEDEGMPNPADVKRLNENVTRRCPSCKKEIYDDAEVCYHCGDAVVASRSRGQSPWVIIVVAAVILGFMISYVWRLF